MKTILLLGCALGGGAILNHFAPDAPLWAFVTLGALFGLAALDVR